MIEVKKNYTLSIEGKNLGIVCVFASSKGFVGQDASKAVEVYHCRRNDNGTLVYAFEDELLPFTKPSLPGSMATLEAQLRAAHEEIPV